VETPGQGTFFPFPGGIQIWAETGYYQNWFTETGRQAAPKVVCLPKVVNEEVPKMAQTGDKKAALVAGEPCPTCGKMVGRRTADYDPHLPIEREPVEQLMKEEPEIPERQVEDGPQGHSRENQRHLANATGDGNDHIQASSVTDAEAPARTDVPPVQPEGACEAHDFGKPEYSKMMGRMLAPCRKCGLKVPVD
jgi:hypothetical protein